MDDGSADPIEDSLKERIKAGGITQVVEKKAGAKPTTATAATKTTAATAVTKPKEEKKTTEAKPVAESKPKEATASTAAAADKRR